MNAGKPKCHEKDTCNNNVYRVCSVMNHEKLEACSVLNLYGYVLTILMATCSLLYKFFPENKKETKNVMLCWFSI
jgi:hypothetical protein